MRGGAHARIIADGRTWPQPGFFALLQFLDDVREVEIQCLLYSFGRQFAHLSRQPFE